RLAADSYLELVQDIDRLLSTRKEFLLGKWIQDATRWGDNDAERNRLEWNARRIVTRWGNGTRLRDYAWKEWSGMLTGFYARRWTILFEYQLEALTAGIPFDREGCDAAIMRFEDEWAHAQEKYPADAQGDSWEEA